MTTNFCKEMRERVTYSLSKIKVVEEKMEHLQKYEFCSFLL